MNPFPSLDDLHQQLLATHPTAAPEIATRLFGRLCQELRQISGQAAPEDLLQHAVGDALLNYFKRPSQYDPAKSELAVYLRMSALGDLKNLLRGERNFREKHQTGVELSNLEGNEETDDDCFLSTHVAEELRFRLRELFLEERDWQMAQLIIDQERQTEPFAEILGIAHLPSEEQRQEVKRNKDRIKQKLRRYGESIRDQYEPD